MFCNQCEQTAKGIACTTLGACGKQANTAAIQDLVVFALRGLALTALEARAKGVVDPATDRLAVQALFMTLTNVNFDDAPLTQMVREVTAARNALAAKAGIGVDAPAEAAQVRLLPVS